MFFSANDIGEFSVLGICYKHPLHFEKVITAAKNLMPELWSPTAEVVDTSVYRCVSAGYLTLNKNEAFSDFVQITAQGKKRLHSLVLRDPGEELTSKLFAWEFLQFCFLDFIDCDTARTVLFRTRSRLQQRLSNFRQRSELCPHTGRFTNLWLSIETNRLETSLNSLNIICEEIDDELQIAKYSKNPSI
jgi:hypothetical protein